MSDLPELTVNDRFAAKPSLKAVTITTALLPNLNPTREMRLKKWYVIANRYASAPQASSAHAPDAGVAGQRTVPGIRLRSQ